MHPGIGLEGESRQARESWIDILFRLATASAGLVRDEIDLVKQEVREKVRLLRTGIIFLAVAIVLGIVALLSLDAALVIAIGNKTGFGLAALMIGVAVLIVAGTLAVLGIRRITGTHLKPEKTIHSLREDKEWLKQTLGRGWSAAVRTPGIGNGPGLGPK
jgi:uncharacterized membrane protein YqjE